MAPLLPEVVNVIPQPMGLPPSCSIEHTIDLILEASFPNAPSYCLAPQEADVIECQPDQLLNSSPTPPSSSPCVSPTFCMPKWVFVPVVSASRLCTPTQVPTYYNTLPGSSSFSKQIIEKASGKQNSYKCNIAGKNHLQRPPFLVGAVNQTRCIGHTCCSSRELVFKGNVETDNEALADQYRVGFAHQQQKKHSTQRSTHTFTQCHLQVDVALPATPERANQRPHKIHMPLFFHPEARVWLLRDKHRFRGKHHQLRPLRYDPNTVRESIGENALQISLFVGGSGDASGSKQGGIGPPEGRPPSFANQ
jgi:hypothetical protein